MVPETSEDSRVPWNSLKSPMAQGQVSLPSSAHGPQQHRRTAQTVQEQRLEATASGAPEADTWSLPAHTPAAGHRGPAGGRREEPGAAWCLHMKAAGSASQQPAAWTSEEHASLPCRLRAAEAAACPCSLQNVSEQ